MCHSWLIQQSQLYVYNAVPHLRSFLSVSPSPTTGNMNPVPGTYSTFATSIVSELTPRQLDPSSNFPTSGPHDPGTSDPYANPYDNPQHSYYVPEATTLVYSPYPSPAGPYGPYPGDPGAGNQVPGGPYPGNPSGGSSSSGAFPGGGQPTNQGVQPTPPLKQPAVIAGIVIGTLVLLIALIALILFLLRRRRLRQQAEIEPPPRE